MSIIPPLYTQYYSLFDRNNGMIGIWIDYIRHKKCIPKRIPNVCISFFYNYFDVTLSVTLNATLNIKMTISVHLPIWSFERVLRCVWTVFWTVEHPNVGMGFMKQRIPPESPLYWLLTGLLSFLYGGLTTVFHAIFRDFYGNVTFCAWTVRSNPLQSNTNVSTKSHFDRSWLET